MKDLLVSPEFTLNDIQNIREYYSARQRAIGDEAFYKELEAEALFVQGQIKIIEPVKRGGK